MNTPSSQSIKSEDLTIEKLFKDFYVVPNFQREYVWADKQVEQLLKDIFAEFPSSDPNSESDEYFIGSIVVSLGDEGEDSPFEVIDGQQRITTAYIFLCAVKNYILALENHLSIDALKNAISDTDTNSKGMDIRRCRVSLQYEDTQNVLEAIAEENVDLDSIPQVSSSTENIINAYRTIQGFLKQEFDINEAEIRRFYAHFTKKVKLVRVLAMSVTRALRVFETINDRGVGLNPMDLLKNLMFRHVAKEDFDILNKKWKELTNIIQTADEKPNTFLRYFIYSKYDDVDRDEVQSKVYEWLLKYESKCGYKAFPVNFVDSLVESAKAYKNLVQGKNKDGTDNRYLCNINFLTGTTKQHMSLLLASYHLDNDSFLKLSHEIENFLFVYNITSQKTNEFERLFIKWASALRKVTDESTLNTFIETYIQPAKQNLAKQFEVTFLDLKEKDIQGTKIKYILAKLTQYIDELAFDNTVNSAGFADLKIYMNRQVEIEHILPQTLNKEIIASFDKPNDIEKYIRRLGNLTLLEKPLNASIQNSGFDIKKNAYKNSKFLLTKSIAEITSVGTNTAINRAVQGLKNFDKWISSSITERQQIMTELAKKVWNVTELSTASTPASSILIPEGEIETTEESI
jgi:uncharacterized protein with ParB-like and HNH nuclease domain